MAYRPSTQANYTIVSRTTIQENQLALQIAAKHTISFLRWCHILCMNLYGAGVSHLRGRIVSHYTTDARHFSKKLNEGK